MNNQPKKFLQERLTKLYIRADGSRTSNPDEAHPIKNVTEALALCRQYKLKGMDVVIKFTREEYDIRLEIGDLC